jgi:hypothetical protein
MEQGIEDERGGGYSGWAVKLSKKGVFWPESVFIAIQ